MAFLSKKLTFVITAAILQRIHSAVFLKEMEKFFRHFHNIFAKFNIWQTRNAKLLPSLCVQGNYVIFFGYFISGANDATAGLFAMWELNFSTGDYGIMKR